MARLVIDWLQGVEADSERKRIKAYLNEYNNNVIHADDLITLTQLVTLEYEDSRGAKLSQEEYTDNTIQETLRKMKTRARNNYIVDSVICLTENASTWFNISQAQKWHERVKDVYVMDFGNYLEPKFEKLKYFEEQFRIDIGEEADEDDIQNALWMNALGLEFTAPPILRQRPNDITDRAPRPSEERRIHRLNGERHVTKNRSNAEGFLQQERCIYTLKEKEEATQIRRFYTKALDTGKMSESTVLMPNYIICPNKEEEKHPTKIRYYKELGCCECEICGYRYNGTEETTEETALYKYITTGYIY